MPWTCPECRADVALDSSPCPRCGFRKAHKTVGGDRARTVLAVETKKFELWRGAGLEPLPAADPGAALAAVASVKADEVVALPAARATALAAAGKVPAPRHQLVVRTFPRADPKPMAVVTVLHAKRPAAVHELPHDRPALTEGHFDLGLVFVHGPGPLPSFPGLSVVDVTDPDAAPGHAAQVTVTGLKAKLPAKLPVHRAEDVVDLDLRDGHDATRPPPASVSVGTRLYVKCRVAPYVDGRYTWSCKDAHVKVEPDQEYANIQPMRAGKVVLRCELKATTSGATHVAEHTLTVEKRRAQLVYPPATARSARPAPHTQYVNLESSVAHPERGSLLKVKAQLDGGRAGEAVFLKLERKPGNSLRNRPDPQVGLGVKEAWCPDTGRVVPMRGDAGTKDCEAEFEVELGYAGGDQFTIHVGGDEACADAHVDVQNLRRLDLALLAPPGIAPNLQKTIDALAKISVELVPAPRVTLTPGEGPSGVRSWDAAGAKLDLGLHNIPWFEDRVRKAAPESPGVPRVFVIAAHTTYTPVDPRIDATLSPTQALSGFTAGTTLTLTLAGKDTFVASPTLDANASPFVQGTWREADARGASLPTGASGPLSAADLTVPTDFGRSVRVTLPAAATAAGCTSIAVYLEVKVCMGVGGFTSPGTDRIGASYADDSHFNHVLTHEIGHVLRQSAAAEKAPGLESLAHGHTYTGKGHTGPHCDFGLAASAADYWAAYPTLGTKTTCVMFGDDSPQKVGAPGQFCEKCEPFARASHVSGLRTAMGT